MKAHSKARGNGMVQHGHCQPYEGIDCKATLPQKDFIVRKRLRGSFRQVEVVQAEVVDLAYTSACGYYLVWIDEASAKVSKSAQDDNNVNHRLRGWLHLAMKLPKLMDAHQAETR